MFQEKSELRKRMVADEIQGRGQTLLDLLDMISSLDLFQVWQETLRGLEQGCDIIHLFIFKLYFLFLILYITLYYTLYYLNIHMQL